MCKLRNQNRLESLPIISVGHRVDESKTHRTLDVEGTEESVFAQPSLDNDDVRLNRVRTESLVIKRRTKGNCCSRRLDHSLEWRLEPGRSNLQRLTVQQETLCPSIRHIHCRLIEHETARRLIDDL
jgi:hypothetical protein